MQIELDHDSAVAFIAAHDWEYFNDHEVVSPESESMSLPQAVAAIIEARY